MFLSGLNVRVICYCWNARVNTKTTCEATPNDLFKLQKFGVGTEFDTSLRGSHCIHYYVKKQP